MTDQIADETVLRRLTSLEERIAALEKENQELRSRINTLELQTGQLTDRILRIGGNCSTCGI